VTSENAADRRVTQLSLDFDGVEGMSLPSAGPPAHLEELATIFHGDCIPVMAELAEGSIDAIVCDPPYGLEFMGKEWDRFPLRDRGLRLTGNGNATEARGFGSNVAYGTTPAALLAFQEWCGTWALAAYRVLKPGGHLVAFGGTRTFHRLTCALEDAGLEIRDCLSWLYGSGFPKSLDVSKAIDKAAGAARPAVRVRTDGVGNTARSIHKAEGFAASRETIFVETAPATDAAKAWQGWGTALKPAWEPIILARKPLGERNVAANVLAHGTGAINVDGCRIAGDVPQVVQGAEDRIFGNGKGLRSEPMLSNPSPLGRWPANLVLDDAAAGMLDAQSGESDSKASSGRNGRDAGGATWSLNRADDLVRGHTDSGGASRFFYTAKADAEDRDGSKHPTVKPVELMKWLIRLVTPPGGVVLDPFLGSGTTVYAARMLGIRSIGIEREAPYVEQAVWRLRQGVLL
jgi:DNA modification methylase